MEGDRAQLQSPSISHAHFANTRLRGFSNRIFSSKHPYRRTLAILLIDALNSEFFFKSTGTRVYKQRRVRLASGGQHRNLRHQAFAMKSAQIVANRRTPSSASGKNRHRRGSLQRQLNPNNRRTYGSHLPPRHTGVGHRGTTYARPTTNAYLFIDSYQSLLVLRASSRRAVAPHAQGLRSDCSLRKCGRMTPRGSVPLLPSPHGGTTFPPEEHSCPCRQSDRFGNQCN